MQAAQAAHGLSCCLPISLLHPRHSAGAGGGWDRGAAGGAQRSTTPGTTSTASLCLTPSVSRGGITPAERPQGKSNKNTASPSPACLPAGLGLPFPPAMGRLMLPMAVVLALAVRRRAGFIKPHLQRQSGCPCLPCGEGGVSMEQLPGTPRTHQLSPPGSWDSPAPATPCRVLFGPCRRPHCGRDPSVAARQHSALACPSWQSMAINIA